MQIHEWCCVAVVKLTVLGDVIGVALGADLSRFNAHDGSGAVTTLRDGDVTADQVCLDEGPRQVCLDEGRQVCMMRSPGVPG